MFLKLTRFPYHVYGRPKNKKERKMKRGKGKRGEKGKKGGERSITNGVLYRCTRESE
jgi:hypothetical protein